MILDIGTIIALTVSVLSLLYLIYSLKKIRKLKSSLFNMHGQLTAERKKQQKTAFELANLQQKLSHDVLTDALTGLPSRKLFEDHLSLTINQSIRYQLTCCVMYLDLDDFKMINDVLGYEVGDTLLKELATRLQNCIRQVDTLSRFGGDEFVFIFSQISRAETAAYIAQRLLDAAAQPFVIQGQELYITASIGVAVFPADGSDGRTLVKNADLAMHQAKSRGCNTYQFYREEMHVLSRRELILNSSLRSAAVYRDFILEYQPQINLENKQVLSMEAFLHWQHTDFGRIEYDELSRFAEQNGSLIVITEWLIRNACQQWLCWQKEGVISQAIAIRISLKQLENPHFIHKLAGIVQETGIDPIRITLELTESSLLQKIEVVEKMLHMLKHLGVQIALNHFGTGHLPLQYLRRLPIDIFKIDYSLTRDVVENKESEAIVKMIIALASSLRCRVVAEGINTDAQKQLLQTLGCQSMQGDLFSPAQLPTQFTASLLQQLSESK